jgi:hypothetical protein
MAPSSSSRGDADASVRAVDEQHVARPEAALADDRVVRSQERLRRGSRLLIVEALRHADDVPLVHDHTVGEAAAADEAEDSIAELPAEHLVSKRDDASADFEPGHVLRCAGRRRVASGALGEVGRVDRRIRLGHDELVAARQGIGPLLEP